MTERFHVAGALLVKLFGRVDREVDLFHDRADRVAQIGVKQAMAGRALFASLGFIGALATALVYLVGGLIVIDNPAIEVGTVVALGLYVTQLYGPLAQLSNARVDLMTALVSFERVFEVLDLPRPIEEHPGAAALVEPSGHVTFDHVWFRFPAAGGSSLESLEGPRSEHGDDASDWILADIDLDLEPGTMVAIVGRSGAGKSTLSTLVPRLHDVTEGRVLLDGHDVRDLTLDSVADAVGVVSQDAHLFHDSIAVNLRYAKPNATDEELVRAATAARIHHVIARLPDGYDTIVGERGYRLSGGEKQRLSIARVLLKDPAVVVLDEATAHLDTESERLVQAALAETLRDGPASSSPTGCRRSSTPTSSSCSTTAGSSSGAHTSSCWRLEASTRSSRERNWLPPRCPDLDGRPPPRRAPPPERTRLSIRREARARCAHVVGWCGGPVEVSCRTLLASLVS
jgi:ATP-binding cassette, subfamily B, bacterial